MTTVLPVIDFNAPDAAKGVGGELEQTNRSLVARMTAVAVIDQASLQQAALDRETIGDAIKRVKTWFEPLKSSAYKLHRALCERENEIVRPLEELDRVKSTAISGYKRQQDQIREAEERRLAEEQRQRDHARAMAEAAALERSGECDTATAVIEEALAAPAPVIVLRDDVKAVVSFRRVWKWKFAGGPGDITQTPPAVLDRAMKLVPREYLMVDPKRMQAAVKLQGAAKVPGITVYYEDVPIR